jgi:hypothetical protein
MVMTAKSREELDGWIDHYSLFAPTCALCGGMIFPETPIGREGNKVTHLIPCGIIHSYRYWGKVGKAGEYIHAENEDISLVEPLSLNNYEYILIGFANTTGTIW